MVPPCSIQTPLSFCTYVLNKARLNRSKLGYVRFGHGLDHGLGQVRLDSVRIKQNDQRMGMRLFPGLSLYRYNAITVFFQTAMILPQQ